MNSQSNEKNMEMNRTNQGTPNIRWMLVGYDLVVYAVVAIILLVLYGGMDKLSLVGICQQVALSVLCIFTARLLGKIYGQVWRYGGIQCYIRLLFTDSIAFCSVFGFGTPASSSKNYICQNAFNCQFEPFRSVSTSYDVSLRI